jgi:predicted Zn-dependent protease
MTKMAKGQPNIPKFLSTHPQNQDRQQRLQSHMQEVLLKQLSRSNQHRQSRKVLKLVADEVGTISQDVCKMESGE